MIGVVNLSAKERQKASANFIKTAGFTAISRLSADAVDRELKAELASAGSLRNRLDTNELNRLAGAYSSAGMPKLSKDGKDRKVEEASSSSSSSTNVMRDGKPSAEMDVREPDQAEAKFEGPAKPAVVDELTVANEIADLVPDGNWDLLLSYTANELRDYAKRLGVSVGGTKQQLVDRITQKVYELITG
jgi:hypothetical protein